MNNVPPITNHRFETVTNSGMTTNHNISLHEGKTNNSHAIKPAIQCGVPNSTNFPSSDKLPHNNTQPALKCGVTNTTKKTGAMPCEKIRRNDGVESDHTDTDYELESAVRHALKNNKDRLNFEDLGAPSIVALLSPSVREVIRNVELVRLPLVGIGSRRSKRLDNAGKSELWPGVASGGAAVQCIHCHESGRHVLSSLLTLWQHLGILAYNHFAHCQTIPVDKGATLESLTPKFNSTSFKLFQTELGVFCQHVAENLRRDSQISVGVPLTTHCHNHGGKFKEGSRVMGLEEIFYQKGMNGKLNVTTKSILKSASKGSEQIPRYKTTGETVLNPSTTPKHVIKKLQNKMFDKAFQELELKKVVCSQSGKRSRKKKGQSFVMKLQRVLYHKGKRGGIHFTCEEINGTKNSRRPKIRGR